MDARVSHDTRTPLERQVADQQRRRRAREDQARRRGSEDVLRALAGASLLRDPAMPRTAAEMEADYA